MIFTCQVFGSTILEWRSPLISPITYLNTSMLSDIITRGPFEANLTFVGSSNDSMDFDITSTLKMTESKETILVECLSTQGNETKSFTIAGIELYKYTQLCTHTWQ